MNEWYVIYTLQPVKANLNKQKSNFMLLNGLFVCLFVLFFKKPTFSRSCPLLGCRKTELGERCLRPVQVPRLEFWTHWGPCPPELQVVHVWIHPRRTRAANASPSAETWRACVAFSTYTHALPKFTILGLPAMKQTSEHRQQTTYRTEKCSFKKSKNNKINISD